jgi:hypothetical protein
MLSPIKQLEMFVKFAAKELSISKLPKIHFVGNKENSKNAFGHSIGSEIYIRITDRHPGDVMRTIAHELIHVKQTQMSKTGEQFKEDEANAIAGRIMRKFNTTYPEIFRQRSIPANLKETDSLVPANSMGASSTVGRTGGIDTYSPLMGLVQKRKKLRDIVSLKSAEKRERRSEQKKDIY